MSETVAQVVVGIIVVILAVLTWRWTMKDYRQQQELRARRHQEIMEAIGKINKQLDGRG